MFDLFRNYQFLKIWIMIWLSHFMSKWWKHLIFKSSQEKRFIINCMWWFTSMIHDFKWRFWNCILLFLCFSWYKTCCILNQLTRGEVRWVKSQSNHDTWIVILLNMQYKKQIKKIEVIHNNLYWFICNNKLYSILD